LPDVKILEIFFWGELDLFVNYFVKTRSNGYHKIVIPTHPSNYLASLFIYFKV
jgi:hypothetical protein